MGLLALISLAGVSIAACRPQPRVTISTQQGRQLTFTVEVADTPSERELGLQFRRELAPDHGMLFIFPSEREQSFWMKNTPIALDMIFINKDQKIVGIVEETVPFSLDPRRVSAPSQFVLEINGGVSRRYTIQPGDTVRFEGIATDVKE